MANQTENSERQTAPKHTHQTVLSSGTIRLIRLVWVLTSAVEFFLLFRLLLKLFKANPNNPFANLIYTVSDALLIPFQNLVANLHIGRYVLEGKSLIALLAYMALSSLLVGLIRAIASRR